MIYEILSLILAVAVGVTGVLAFVYKRGQKDGIDTACGNRIEEKIDNMQQEGEEVHNELKKDIGKVTKDIKMISSKLDTLKGSFDTFKDLVKPKT